MEFRVVGVRILVLKGLRQGFLYELLQGFLYGF